jgi:hypothetical protein
MLLQDKAVDLLSNAAALLRKVGRWSEFIIDLESLRTKYKTRRNFIRRVENNRERLFLGDSTPG